EIAACGIDQGLVVVSAPHTTCGITINEDEAGLRGDIERLATKLLDPLGQQAPFDHDRIDDNAQAHLTSILFGHSVHLPLSGSRLGLGRWQSVLLVEMDGPRSRSVSILILGL
ncbi:MAG: secondary thiamine-phosphate synthase enzyme YjbQ, partial [Acidobacteriota bacterium]